MRLDLQGGQRQFFLMDGGVAQMKDNKLTVVTGEATASSEIDAETARAALAEAEARQGDRPKSAEDRERQLARRGRCSRWPA